VRWAIDLGYAFRRQTEVGNLTVDDELRARAGVGVELVDQVELAATVSAATAADDPFADFARDHLELVGGPECHAGPALAACSPPAASACATATAPPTGAPWPACASASAPTPRPTGIATA
jgi:hypothetical protein